VILPSLRRDAAYYRYLACQGEAERVASSRRSNDPSGEAVTQQLERQMKSACSRSLDEEIR